MGTGCGLLTAEHTVCTAFVLMGKIWPGSEKRSDPEMLEWNGPGNKPHALRQHLHEDASLRKLGADLHASAAIIL